MDLLLIIHTGINFSSHSYKISGVASWIRAFFSFSICKYTLNKFDITFEIKP
jgi:hypothetical protein